MKKQKKIGRRSSLYARPSVSQSCSHHTSSICVVFSRMKENMMTTIFAIFRDILE